MGKITAENKKFLSLNVAEDGKISNTMRKKIERKALRKKNLETLVATRGLIYVGHIPHGFYEEEMKEYFSQFGRVTNVKVCRSSISGKSKGYGFVEFTTPEVAKIASETMNNYLMFKKRVVSSFIPLEERPKFLFKTARPKKVVTKLRHQKQVLSKNKRLDNDSATAKKTRTVKRLAQKLEKLKKFGCEHDIKPVE